MLNCGFAWGFKLLKVLLDRLGFGLPGRILVDI